MALFDFLHFKPKEKGVTKDEARKASRTDFIGFFRTYFEKFWNISNLNLVIALYLVLLALGIWTLQPYPVVFYIFLGVFALMFGPLCAGVFYVVRGYVRGDPVFIVSDFTYAVKHNWKQSIIIGLLDLLITGLLIFDVLFWSGTDINYLTSYVPENVVEITQEADTAESGAEITVTDDEQAPGEEEKAEVLPFGEKTNGFLESMFFYASIILFIVYLFMKNYIYIITVTFNLSVYKIFKNAFLFSILGIKRNILGLLGKFILLFVNVIIFVNMPMVGILLALIITIASCAFIGAYAAYPVIKKYMITPYYKDEEVYESYDKIFEDRG
ncbi:MAG: DUF624 domain-containing protein [Clostridiales bacterium]|nr:DUF624 domain-containing protein [Clostridiales bacterium]